MKYLIGITGNFGSGKSFVGDILKKHAVVVIDTDQIVSEILLKKNKITKNLVKLFGKSIINKSSRCYINKKALGIIAFKEPKLRRMLQNIIHPEVRKIVKNKIARIYNTNIIAVLIPLLFETGQSKYYDEIWCVVCRNNIRIKRLKLRGFTENEIKLRLKAQMPEIKKIKKADFVIDNSGAKKITEKQVSNRLKQLVQSSHSLRLLCDK